MACSMSKVLMCVECIPSGARGPCPASSCSRDRALLRCASALRQQPARGRETGVLCARSPRLRRSIRVSQLSCSAGHVSASCPAAPDTCGSGSSSRRRVRGNRILCRGGGPRREGWGRMVGQDRKQYCTRALPGCAAPADAPDTCSASRP